MAELTSLTSFFRNTGLMYRVFDMGRCIKPMANGQFSAFEQLQLPYPSPYQQHAWFGILLWNPQQKEQHSIWFLKLPLDETNLLIPTARDYLLSRLLQGLSEQKQGGDLLKDNPFTFSPDEPRLAIFHEYARQALGAAATAVPDLTSQPWQTLSWQQLATLVLQLDDKQQQSLAQAINKDALPNDLVSHLSILLEQIQVGTALTEALVAWCERHQGYGLPNVVRALAQSKASPLLIPLLTLGEQEAQKDACLAWLSRSFKHLEYLPIRQRVLQQLLDQFSDEDIYTLLRDLMSIASIAPTIRRHISEDMAPQARQRLDAILGVSA